MNDQGNNQAVKSTANRYLRSILVKNEDIRFVDVADIIWIEASGNYVRLHCEHESHMIRASLKNMEEKLNPKKFIRIHKSSMINIYKVTFIKSCDTGDLKAEMENGKTLNVSRNYKGNLEKFKI